MKNIIIDCDPGIDDALAIILAIKSKLVQIDGISTVAGNSSIENTAKNALKILELSGNRDIPVYRGMEKPLEGKFLSGEDVHGKDGLAENNIKDPSKSWEETNAVDFLVDYVQEHPNNNTIIAVGPLTNIARSIQDNSTFKDDIEELIVMGGAIKNPGNVTRTAEFNIYSDPEAAKIVFECGIKNIILVPLDVTQKVIFPPELLERIDYGSEKKQHSLAGFIHDILDFYIQFCSNVAGYNGCPLHDPLAVGEAIDPSFMEKKAMDVRIVTKSQTFGIEKNENNNPSRELIRGQTVAELRKGINIKEARPNVNVCMDVDANRFLEYFIKTINS